RVADEGRDVALPADAVEALRHPEVQAHQDVARVTLQVDETVDPPVAAEMPRDTEVARRPERVVVEPAGVVMDRDLLREIELREHVPDPALARLRVRDELPLRTAHERSRPE